MIVFIDIIFKFSNFIWVKTIDHERKVGIIFVC